MNWQIEFAPLIDQEYLLAWSALAAILALALIAFTRRGGLLRALSLASIIAALANPTFKQEDREALTNIALVIIDKSASQAIANRDRRSQKIRTELEQKISRIGSLETRWINSSAASADNSDGGTNLFNDLNQALADIPPDRLAGVIFITDGQVHDVPLGAGSLNLSAPIHTLLTGTRDEFDRRIKILKAPKYP